MTIKISDFTELNDRIISAFGSVAACAEAAGLSPRRLRWCLNGEREFRASEINQLKQLLQIQDFIEAERLFFTVREINDSQLYREYRIKYILEKVEKINELSDTIIDILYGLLC